MVPGVGGDLGPTVLRPVVEELRQGGDTVTVQPTVVETAMVMPLSRDSVALTPVRVKHFAFDCWLGPTFSINNSSGRTVGSVDVLEQLF